MRSKQSVVWRFGNGLWQQLNVRSTRVVLGTALSLLFLWLAFRGTPLVQILDAFTQADYRYVALALSLVLLSPLVRAVRWKLLYHPDHAGLRISRLAVILLIGQMLNIVAPARAGEIARIYFMGRTENRSRALTLGTIAIEKWLDILMVLILLLFMPAVVALPAWFQDSRAGLGAFAGAFFGAALVLSYGQSQLMGLVDRLAGFMPPEWQERTRRGVSLALSSLDVLRSPRVGLQLQVWSFFIWALSILVNYLTFKALGIPLSLTAALFLLAVLQVGVAVPSAPGKLGVFHYLCILALGFFGVDRGTALGYSFLLYTIVFLPPVILGTIGLWVEVGRSKGDGAMERWRKEKTGGDSPFSAFR